MELEGAEWEGASDIAYGVPNSTHRVVEKVMPDNMLIRYDNT